MFAGVGMGNMTQNLCALSWVLGFNSAMDTLVSQAVGGNNYELCGVYLNRGRFLMTLMFIPITIVLMNSERILVAAYQDPEVAKFAQLYVITNLPGIYLIGLSDCQRRFLNNFGKNNISFYAGFSAMVLHSFWSYIFVIKLDLEIIGTGLANVTTQITIFMMLYWFTKREDQIQEAVFMPDKRVLSKQGTWDYVKLGVPGVV